MNPTQIFEFARDWIYSENIKCNPSATGPKPRSAQSHSAGAARGHPGAQPTATRGAAHAHGAGAARVRGPRQRGDGPAWPRPAQRAVLHDGLMMAPTGARETAERRGGSPARGRRRGTTATGERRGDRPASTASNRGGREAIGRAVRGVPSAACGVWQVVPTRQCFPN
jgi:hypothetical protein